MKGTPQLGRRIHPEEQEDGKDFVMFESRARQRRFGADPQYCGQVSLA